MAKGFDCATPLTAALAAAFRACGYEFVARYLVPDGWKALTKDEAEAISRAGLQIVSVFETTANRALDGQAAGLADGVIAVQVAKAVGQPEGSSIYYAVDFDATAAQMPAVIEYIKGVTESTQGYSTGVYGSYDVVEVVRSAGACSKYWQTRAWSNGKMSDASNIYQYDCGPQGLGLTAHGIGVDLDEFRGDEGGWNTVQVIKLQTNVANNIIDTFLSKSWNSCEEQRLLAEKEGRSADAEAWLQLREWQHTLANELRKASGQPEQ